MLELENPPSDSKFLRHHFADFVELLALSQDEEGIDKDSASDRMLDSEGSQDNQELINDCFEILAYRHETYGENYPFLMETNHTLKLRISLSNTHKAYIFLLLCSCTSKCTSKSLASDLRRDFEHICASAFKNYLPSFAECHIFGKSGLESKYSGHITNKLSSLANDIGAKISFDPDDFSRNDSGDGGLDLVAWLQIPGDSYKKYSQLYFIQCATGREWKNKQHEPDPFNNHLSLNSNYTLAICVPYDSRKTNGIPLHHLDITVPIYLDRYRLLKLLGDSGNIESIDSYRHIQSAIDYTESII